MATLGPQNSALMPTTFIWDTSEIYATNFKDEVQFRELLVRLYQNLNRMQILLNGKDDGTYNIVNEQVTGQNWFMNPSYTYATSTTPVPRSPYRLVINFGALPNAATKSVAHGITMTTKTTFTKIYGAASDTTGFNYIPLPYASPTLVNNIELNVDATNVNVITGSNRTNFNICYIILEYLQI